MLWEYCTEGVQEQKIQDLEAGATQLCIVPHPPTRTCTLFVEIVFFNAYFLFLFLFYLHYFLVFFSLFLYILYNFFLLFFYPIFNCVIVFIVLYPTNIRLILFTFVAFYLFL